MCVICVAKPNQALNEQELKNCFSRNKDGAGYMVATGKTVYAKKGFFKFEDLWKELESLDDNSTRVIHFRIATSGKISAKTCHPFPICYDVAALKETEFTSDLGIAHNGVLADFSPTNGMFSEVSDTMAFISAMNDHLRECFNNRATRYLIEKATEGNRIALLNKDGEVLTFGNWVESVESGLLYSNESFTPTKFRHWYQPIINRTAVYLMGLTFNLLGYTEDMIEAFLIDLEWDLADMGLSLHDYENMGKPEEFKVWIPQTDLRLLPATLAGETYTITNQYF